MIHDFVTLLEIYFEPIYVLLASYDKYETLDSFCRQSHSGHKGTLNLFQKELVRKHKTHVWCDGPIIHQSLLPAFLEKEILITIRFFEPVPIGIQEYFQLMSSEILLGFLLRSIPMRFLQGLLQTFLQENLHRDSSRLQRFHPPGMPPMIPSVKSLPGFQEFVQEYT